MLRYLILSFFMPYMILAQDKTPEDHFKTLLQIEELEGINISASFITPSGDDIFHFHEKERKIPASSFKPVTTGFLWLEKGAEHRWRSTVSIVGKINQEGVLKGNVVITPSGDPAFASRYVNAASLGDMLHEIHTSLRNSGITCIDGHLVLDVSGFQDNPVPGTWPREDVGNYYGAGYFAMNVLDNSYEICFEGQRRVGDVPRIKRVEPALNELNWEIKLQTAEKGTGDQAYIFGGPETDHKVIYGTIPAGENDFCIKGSMPDPPGFFLDTLSAYCEKRGMQHNGVRLSNSVLDNRGELIWEHLSPTLEEMAQPCLHKSLNSYADGFLFELSGDEGRTWSDAISVLADKIDAVIPAGPATVLYDGSGMSPSNGISSAKLAGSLAYFYNNIEVPGSFMNCFTRDNRNSDIRLKSGSLAGVVSYSGYILKEKAQPVCFSIMANQVHSEQKDLVRQQMLQFIRTFSR